MQKIPELCLIIADQHLWQKNKLYKFYLNHCQNTKLHKIWEINKLSRVVPLHINMFPWLYMTFQCNLVLMPKWKDLSRTIKTNLLFILKARWIRQQITAITGKAAFISWSWNYLSYWDIPSINRKRLKRLWATQEITADANMLYVHLM